MAYRQEPRADKFVVDKAEQNDMIETAKPNFVLKKLTT